MEPEEFETWLIAGGPMVRAFFYANGWPEGHHYNWSSPGFAATVYKSFKPVGAWHPALLTQEERDQVPEWAKKDWEVIDGSID